MASEYFQISTASVGEGMDFACSLASDAIARAGRSNPSKSSELLDTLTSYIQFRYVGEDELALEFLSFLGQACDQSSFRSAQFWSQLRWVAKEMELEGDALAKIQLPEGSE